MGNFQSCLHACDVERATCVTPAGPIEERGGESQSDSNPQPFESDRHQTHVEIFFNRNRTIGDIDTSWRPSPHEDDNFSWLKANDPFTVEAQYSLYDNDFAEDLGRALIQNTHVTKLSLSLKQGLTSSGYYGTLLKFIQQSSTLQEVQLEDECSPLFDSRITLGSPAVIDHFMQAVTRNPSIERLSLRNCMLFASTLSNVISHASQLTKLSLITISVDGALQDLNDVEKYDFTHSSLASLSIEDVNASLLISILCRLPSISSICRVSFIIGEEEEATVLTSKVIGNFLHNNQSIEFLEAGGWIDCREEAFRPIVHAVINHQKLRSLSIVDTSFDMKSEILFKSLFEENNGVEHLSIYGVCFPTKPLSSILRSKTGVVKKLEISPDSLGFDLLATLENRHSLEELSFHGAIDSTTWQFKAICDSIPKLQGIRKLNIVFVGDEYNRRNFIQALAQNGCLEEVITNTNSFFDENDRELMKSYCYRNKNIRRFIESPNLVSRALLPLVMKRALEKQGPDQVFRSFECIH